MKEKFLWGSATAAYQCEGGWQEGNKRLSNWDDFCHSDQNNINPVNGDTASDFYHTYEEDIRMAAQGNQNAFRFSLAWTRIMDEHQQMIPEGVAFYQKVIDTCIQHKMEPLVTLYHYDLPLNLYKKGGWENRETVDEFVRYARACFQVFRQKVKYWVTINEPGYETLCCYGYGNYPPNVQSLERRWRAMYHMLLASAKAVCAFREMNGPGMIGLVSDSYSIEILKDDADYCQARECADLFYNRCVNDVCIKGVYPQELVRQLTKEAYDLSYMRECDQAVLKAGVVDFLGLNAYDRICVKPYTGNDNQLFVNNTGRNGTKHGVKIKGWFAFDQDPDTPKNAWGMEMYPVSIYRLLHSLHKQYPGTPIIITENGLGYYDKIENGKVYDTYRAEFLAGYLKWIWKAKEEGVDIRGYFVWSTMDLYSWINGYQKRYGLVYVDYEHGNRRIPKESYYWYRDFIAKMNADKSLFCL